MIRAWLLREILFYRTPARLFWFVGLPLLASAMPVIIGPGGGIHGFSPAILALSAAAAVISSLENDRGCWMLELLPGRSSFMIIVSIKIFCSLGATVLHIIFLAVTGMANGDQGFSGWQAAALLLGSLTLASLAAAAFCLLKSATVPIFVTALVSLGAFYDRLPVTAQGHPETFALGAVLYSCIESLPGSRLWGHNWHLTAGWTFCGIAAALLSAGRYREGGRCEKKAC